MEYGLCTIRLFSLRLSQYCHFKIDIAREFFENQPVRQPARKKPGLGPPYVRHRTLLFRNPCTILSWFIPTVALRGFVSPFARDERSEEGMRKYVLEVRAKFEPLNSPSGKAEQLAKDIAHRIISVYQPISDEEQIIRDNRYVSPLFHRLYINLVDNDNTLEKKVEELREAYRPHRAFFNLTPQAD